MLVRVLYKPPPCHLPSFLLMFGQFLANMPFGAMPVIVTGDFNVDLLCDNNRKAELLAFMSDRGFVAVCMYSNFRNSSRWRTVFLTISTCKLESQCMFTLFCQQTVTSVTMQWQALD